MRAGAFAPADATAGVEECREQGEDAARPMVTRAGACTGRTRPVM